MLVASLGAGAVLAGILLPRPVDVTLAVWLAVRYAAGVGGPSLARFAVVWG